MAGQVDSYLYHQAYPIIQFLHYLIYDFLVLGYLQLVGLFMAFLILK
jgi:hypothetical protein